MVHMRLRRSQHRLLRIFPTLAPRFFFSGGRKCVCQLSVSKEETSCFTSAAVVYLLWGEVLFKRSKEMEITGPSAGSLACDLLPRNDWEVMEQSPWSPHIAPRDISWDPLSSIWLASCFQQTPKWSKCRRLQKTLDIDLVSANIHTSVPWWDKSLDVSAEYAEFWCVPSGTSVPCVLASKWWYSSWHRIVP
jgi:hypothetical protein